MKKYIVIFSLLILLLILSRNKGSISSRSEIIKGLYTQTARWATASIQDKSPLISVLHANYAHGYVQALQQSFSEKEIFDVTGRDVRKLSKYCSEIQKNATLSLVRNCPNIIEKTELSEIAGESI